MKETIIGIDLGTTNSAVGLLRDGKPEIIEIEGAPTMPSCVGIDANGKLIVGQTALNQLIAAPAATILSVKRSMGTSVTLPLGSKAYSPVEISSFILRALKEHAEAHLDSPVTKAVITVPAYLGEAQRKATKQAAELAGLEPLRILNEPTAAALAYDATSADNEKLLVYDLGGGTFDVSVVVVENGVVEVQASHGDTQLGGDDFDQCLIDHVVSWFQKEYGEDLTNDLKAMRRLKVSLEQAKRTLSDEPFVRVREDYITEGKHLDIEISRDEYEAMIDSYLQKTLTCIHKAMEDASLVPSELDKILLVGGSSRTPAVSNLIESQMGIEPRSEVDPDLIVAMGAGIQAGNLAGETSQAILVDITPHTFSTSTVDFDFGPFERCVALIKRNSALPAAKSDVFFTMHDGQSQVKVTVYQGEHDDPNKNTLIGDFMVNGLDSNAKEGSPLILKFELDLNGMLKVTATEKNTGLAKQVVMDTHKQGRHFDLDDARENIRELTQEADTFEVVTDEDESDDHQGLLTTAKNLRKRGEALCEAGVGEDDATEIKEMIQGSAEAVRAQDWEKLQQLNDALGDILFYLED